MKRFLLAVVASVLLSATCSFGQEQTKSDSDMQASVVPVEERATREDVLALLEVMHSRRQMVAVMDTMKEQMQSQTRASFLQEHRGASPAVLKKLEGTMDSVWQVIKIDELTQAVIPIYQKYLSHEDVVSLVSFYSSPSGQHYLARMPALIKESGETGGKVMQAHMEQIQRGAREKFAEFEKYVAAHPEELGAASTNDSNK